MESKSNEILSVVLNLRNNAHELNSTSDKRIIFRAYYDRDLVGFQVLEFLFYFNGLEVFEK